MSQTTYGWNAADYARNSGQQLAWAKELLAGLELSGDESLLDIGCGEGKITAQIAGLLPRGRALGIDFAVEMIRYASQEFPPERFPNLSFRQMDAAAIKLPREFEVAFSNAALHWVADHHAILEGVRACLKEGGRIHFQMGGRGNAEEIEGVVREICRRSRWEACFRGFPSPYHFYDVGDYERWLPEHGFAPASVKLIPKDMRHEGREGLIGWLRTVWLPYTDRVPAADRSAFLDEIADAYLSRFPLDSDGIAHVKMVRLQVEAAAM